MLNLFNNIIFIFNPINVRLDNYLQIYIKDNKLINLLKICIISDLAISLTFLGLSLQFSLNELDLIDVICLITLSEKINLLGMPILIVAFLSKQLGMIFFSKFLLTLFFIKIKGTKRGAAVKLTSLGLGLVDIELVQCGIFDFLAFHQY